MTADQGSWRRRLLLAVAVTVATLAAMLATEPRLAIVWDEGYTLGRQERLRLWFQALADPPRFAAAWQPPVAELVQPEGAPAPRGKQIDSRGKLLFDPDVLAWFWPFARAEPHGHPPFYALVGLAGDLLAPRWGPLPRARLGPMLVFSLTAGMLCLFLTRRYGAWHGLLAAGAWVCQPNLFAHGHYATYDALLASLWLNAILAFARAVEASPGTEPRRPRWGWVLLFGLLAGCAADTKFTGWLLPLPLLAWTLLYRSRRGALTLLLGGAVALLVLYVLNPPWWTEPIAGVTRFLESNLTRDKTRPIPVLFLGHVYLTPIASLPWYNTLVWTVLVVPAGFLLLALAGAVRAVARWRSEPFGMLAVGNWAFLLLLRALPHTPGHDGVRQILPAFGILALVAGLGAAGVIAWRPRVGKALVVAALAEGALSVALFMPVPLSYFSPLVGGLPGAARLGMEPTYYWDALTDDALDWLNGHPHGKVAFATYPTSWLYLRQTGRLRVPCYPGEPGWWAWYVLQNRPGEFRFDQRRLAAQGRPAYVVRKQGVPLLWIFPYTEWEKAGGGIGGRARPASGTGTTAVQ